MGAVGSGTLNAKSRNSPNRLLRLFFLLVGKVTDEAKRTLWRWLVGGFGFVMTTLVGLMVSIVWRVADKIDTTNEKVATMSIQLALVTSELEKAAPNDVREEVRASSYQIRSEMVKREELARIIQSTAPWAVDRQEWQRWRTGVDETHKLIEARLKALEK